MLSFIVGVVVGLFVGWILLPEPVWVRDLWSKWGWASRS